MLGKSLGHYRIVHELGSGGMGQVFAAEDTKLKRRVALKVLPPDLAKDRDRQERLQREAEAIAALDHANIVTVHSIESATVEPRGEEGEESLLHFITMQLVEGKTLGEEIPPEGMSLDSFLGLALPLTDGLAAAHQAGVTHRDLKPSNIMVGADRRLRILDFGLAKLRAEGPGQDSDENDATQAVTQEGTVLGTAPYMSPEQAQGLAVDSRSDIFSLGVIFHEMLTGKRPFRGDTPMAVISSILRDTPDSVSDLKTDLPPRIDRILQRCLQKSPGARYQTARDLHSDLVDLKEDSSSGRHASAEDLRSHSLEMYQSRSGSGALAIPARPSLAVLPFTNLSGDPEQDYFAGGLSADINADLVKISGLFLISQTTTQLYANKAIDPREVGRELGVAHVLVGTLRKAGNRVRITAQLVDTRSGAPVWADRFDGSLDDLFTLQDEITEKIVTALDVQLASGEGARIVRQSFQNPAARDLFYRAMPMAFGQTREGFLEARRLLAEVSRVEPKAAIPFALAAWTHFFEARMELEESPPDLLEKAMKLADQAIELGDNSGMAQMLKGTLLLMRREHEAALEAAEKALTDRPSCPWAFALKGQIYNYTGRATEAIDLATQAIRLTPLFPPLFPAVLASGHYLCDQPQEAIAAARGTIDLAPENLEAQVMLAASLAAAGQAEEAKDPGREILRIKPEFSLEGFAASQPFQDQADLERLLGDLGVAGLS
ncbi:MAG: protein kinase [Acidobacteriota bacterium]